MEDWPLEKVSKPHRTNDVLWEKEKKKAVELFLAGSFPQQQQREGCHGNQRFRQRLEDRLEEYSNKDSFSRPLVAVEILQQWRQQLPPGRFLARHQDDDLLWKDVGNARARYYISQALKQLIAEEAGKSGCGNTTTTTTTTTSSLKETLTLSATNSDESITDTYPSSSASSGESSSLVLMEGMQQSEILQHTTASSTTTNHSSGRSPLPPDNFSIPTSLTQFPSPPPTKKKIVRRISEHLSSFLHGRQEERQSLVAIFQAQAQQQPQAAFGRSRGSGGGNISEKEHKTGFVLIKGPMGVGRTALARTLIRPRYNRQQSYHCDDDNNDGDDDDELLIYDSTTTTSKSKTNLIEPSAFLEGKFEHLQSPNPYKVFRDIFTDFCNQLSRRKNSKLVEQYRIAITEAVPQEDDIGSLIRLIPALGSVLRHPKQQPQHQQQGDDGGGVRGGGPVESKESATTGSKRRNKRVNRSDLEGSGCYGNSKGALFRRNATSLFVKLIQAISSVEPDKPLVIFFDDLHFASETSLDIMTSLVADVDVTASVVFVASIRDGYQCDHNHHHKKMMDRLLVNEIDMNIIQLNNLKEEDVEHVLEDTLQCGHDKFQSLSNLVYSLTDGNPLFIKELLRSFQDEGIIRMEPSSGQWHCDVDKISASFQGVKNVTDLFQKKVLDLPTSVQDTLIDAACLGSSKIDESIMTILSSSNEELTLHLSTAVHAGLLRQKEHTYHFISDGCSLAIYNLVPDDETANRHLEIGRKLWCALESRDDTEFLFLLLNQVMMGESLLVAEDDRRYVASLCLKAGEAAAQSQNFSSAWVYLNNGLSLLPSKGKWGRDNYDLSLRLHNASIEVCYCNANYDTLDELVIEILEHARTFEDALLARSTQIFALGSRNRLVEAINSGLQTLTELGEGLPPHPSLRQALRVVRKTKRLLRRFSDEGILRISPLKNQKQLQVLSVLNHLFLYAFYSRPPLALIVSARMVQITVEFGLCAMSSVAFAFYSMFLCGCGDPKEGLRYGEVSLKLYERFKTEAWLCRTWTSYYGSVASWKVPVDATIAPLTHAYSVGIRTGDVEHAMLSASIICWNNSEIVPLPVLESQIRKAIAAMKLSGHTLAIAMLEPQWIYVRAFMVGNEVGEKKEWFIDLIGQGEAVALESSNEGVLMWTRAVSMCVCYFFLDYDTAESYSHDMNKIYDNNAYCGTGTSMVMFIECMVLMAQASKGLCQRWRLLRVKTRLKRLQGFAHVAPTNVLSKVYMIQAELAAIKGRHMRACADYRSAILHSRNRGCLSEEALATERLATYMLQRGDILEAKVHFKEAYRVYESWGATAKMRHLRQVHGSLLEEA